MRQHPTGCKTRRSECLLPELTWLRFLIIDALGPERGLLMTQNGGAGSGRKQRRQSKRIVFFLLPEVFCDQKYAENAIAAGAPPRTSLGELMTLPRPPSRLGSGHPSPYPTPLGAFGASMLAPSTPRSPCPLTPNPADATDYNHLLR